MVSPCISEGDEHQLARCSFGGYGGIFLCPSLEHNDPCNISGELLPQVNTGPATCDPPFLEFNDVQLVVFHKMGDPNNIYRLLR